MKNLVNIILLIAVFCTCIFSQSITQTIRGRVFDNLTEAPLPLANIVILNTDPLLGTNSDLDGNFYLENVPVGRHNIQVTMMGYESYIMNELLVSSGQQPVLAIGL